MARKASKKSAPTKKRHRRSDDELIEDLQNKLREVKARSETKRLKESPAIKAAHSAVRYIDKALESAQEEDNTVLRHALADARRPLDAYLSSQGIRLQKVKLPRGRRPQALLDAQAKLG